MSIALAWLDVVESAALFIMTLLNVTVPKFVKGSTPPLDGASTIHSAEEVWAVASVWVVVNVGCEPSVMLKVNEPLPLETTDAEMVSPALTVMLLIFVASFGYISYQA